MTNTPQTQQQQNWIKWFIGFLDAEGNFQIFPKRRKNKQGVITSVGVGYGFHLGLSLRDLPVLRSIQAMLGGIGKISEYPHKNEAHYAITKKNELLAFIAFIFPYYSLLTAYQYKRFCVLKLVLEQNIVSVASMEEYKRLLDTPYDSPSRFTYIPTLILTWIVGFVNGEGYFGITANGTVFRFFVEHTDRHVLDIIVAVLGLSLNVNVLKQREGRKQTYSVDVSSAADIEKVVKFFDGNEPLKGFKLKQYQEWREKWLQKMEKKGKRKEKRSKCLSRMP
jgi:hypothetical protein